MLDLYLLRNFCGYFLLVMVGFVFLFEIFTFFELLDNIAKNHTPFLVVLNYFRFLVPFLVLSPGAFRRAGGGDGDARSDVEEQ